MGWYKNLTGIERLTKVKKLSFDIHVLSSRQIMEINKFHQEIGINSRTLIELTDFVLNQLTNYITRYKYCKRYANNNPLKYNIIRYGKINGLKRYNRIKQAKINAFPNRKEFWIDKGLTEKEALYKIKKIQTERSKKSPVTKKGVKTSRTKEFWENKGFSEEESQQKVSKVQSTFSLDKCIKKYGKQKGIKRWEQRQLKWQASKQANPNYEHNCWKQGLGLKQFIYRYGEEKGKLKYKEYRDNRGSWSRASKESMKIFDYIENICLENNLKYYYGKGDNKEFFLTDGNKKTFFYDFCLPELKLLFEYNGESYHPNKRKLTETEFSEWSDPWNTWTGPEKWSYDQYKLNLAQQNGYKTVIIWSSDDISSSITQLVNLIKDTISQKTNELS